MGKKCRTITVCESVDVDIDVDIEDYVDEIIEEAEDEELISELVSRGYSVSNTRKHDFGVSKSENKRFLCDILGLSYYSNNDDIINEIKNSI